MTDLTDFLLARIAEDERTAQAALGLLGIETDWHTVEELRERGLTRADARLVHLWSPRRVLAECEAKRCIVERHADGGESQGFRPPGDGHYGYHPHACLTCGSFGEYGEPWPCPTLRDLALPYADHEDYRDEWKP